MDASTAAALLAPASVALVGASDDPSKTAGRPLPYLRRAGYPGIIYPINARGGTVQGEPAWKSLADLPARPDHAFILLGTDLAIMAIEECGRLGIKAATVMASGFAETGPEGAAKEEKLRAAAKAGGVRMIGPSSLGLANLHQHFVLTANAAFAEPDLPLGNIFCASQSGSMIGALVSRGKAKGVHFAGLVSVGSEADLGLAEICEATLDDPHVESYLLFLETIRDAVGLRRFAVGAAARGKPIVAFKLGRSAAARALAVSHTGALAGEADLVDALLDDCGIARIETLEGLLESPRLLQRLPVLPKRVRPPTVGVVTTTGGGAAMVVDQLGMRGVTVEGPGESVLAAVRALGIDVVAGPILDVTLAGARYEVMKGALDALQASGRYDLVVAVAGSSARFQPELAVKPIVDCAAAGMPLAAFLVPEAPQALALLTEKGVPAFRTPEACADAVAAALRRRQPRALPEPVPGHGEGGRFLDELEGYALLDRFGVAHAPVQEMPVAAAGKAAPPFAFPVVVKALHAELPHKSDVGGVALGISSAAELGEAARKIASSVQAARPELSLDRVLVQKMERGLGEVLLGYRVDPLVGPVVLLAAGGVLAEILRDRAVRLAPVDEDMAREMIAEVRVLRAYEGVRGRPAADLDALARTIVSVSKLASARDPAVLELEINPLILRPRGEGVVAVDVLARVGD